MTLKELRLKYSGQAIPEWELIKAGLKKPETSETVEKRKPKKGVVIDGDTDADLRTGSQADRDYPGRCIGISRGY